MQLRLLADFTKHRKPSDHGRSTSTPRYRAAASGRPDVRARVILQRK
jgi:hypothetical protein